MYIITGNCQGFITSAVYKDRLEVDEFEALVKDLNGHIKDNRLYVLTDLRDAKMCTNNDDIYAMERINRLYREPNIIIYEAILVRGVLELALTNFFNKTRVSPDHNIKVFSSEPDAIAWLKSYQHFIY